MCNSRFVSEHRIPAVPGFSFRFGARLSWLTYFVVLFRPPRDFPGGTAKCPRRYLFFLPTSSFRSIILSHVIIQNYYSVPRRHSEIFSCPTSSFGTILASHVIIRNYSCAPRRHSEVFSRLTSIRIILAPHVIIRELFFRPTSPFGNNSSVRRHTLFPWSTRARMHAHTYTKKSKINYEL